MGPVLLEYEWADGFGQAIFRWGLNRERSHGRHVICRVDMKRKGSRKERGSKLEEAWLTFIFKIAARVPRGSQFWRPVAGAVINQPIRRRSLEDGAAFLPIRP